MDTEQKIEEFFSNYPSHTYSKGQILLEPGTNPSGVIYIYHGLVRQYDIADNGDEIVVNVFRPGAHFPMTWAINGEDNVWYFDAIDETKVAIAPAENTLQLLKDNPDVMFLYLKRLCSGASGQQRRMAHLMGGSARSRVLFELIVEFKRFSKSDETSLSINVSESELAAKAGLSREAVNRELGALKSKGIIKREYKTITISNLDKLSAELGQSI